MNEFMFIDLAASDSFGRGKEYGERAADEIGLCVETYKGHLSHMQGLSWSDARAEAMRYYPLVYHSLPEETEMLEGVAEGSGFDFEEIMVLNTRYEMLHYPKKECTTFGLLRGASRDGKVFVGQNWDQRPFAEEHSVILRMTLEDGTKVMGAAEAGQLPRNGLNSRGLGLVANSLKSKLDARGPGIPGNFLRMRALRSKTFGEMAEVIHAFQRSVSSNYCIASAAENKVLDIEAIPGFPGSQRPGGTHPAGCVITHANTILTRPELEASKSTRFRGDRLAELLRWKAGAITVDTIKECLSDHKEFPKSVCAHPEDEITDPHKVWKTVASIIYDLTALEMHACLGNPCTGNFKTYRLK